jgi:hypothetical protein
MTMQVPASMLAADVATQAELDAAIAASAAFIQAGTGAVARTVQNKLREVVSVKDFGAVGDGVTDDTAAINNAISASTDKTIVFDGKFLISSTITISNRVQLLFTGAAGLAGGSQLPSSYLLKKSTMTTAGLSINCAGVVVTRGGVIGSVGNAGNGIDILANNVTLDMVMAYLAGAIGIRIGLDSVGGNVNTVLLNRVVSSFNGSHGIYIHDASNNANACVFIQPFAQSNGGDGIRVGFAAVNTIVGPLVEGNTGAGLKFLSTSYDNQIFGGDIFEANTGGNLVLDAGSTGNKFFGLPQNATGGISDLGTNNNVIGYSNASTIGYLIKDMSGAAGTTVITGLGFKPSSVKFQGCIPGTSTICDGFDNKGQAQLRYSIGTSFYWNGNNSVGAEVTSGNYQLGLITDFSNDGFTITWSKAGTPTGNLLVQYEAFR